MANEFVIKNGFISQGDSLVNAILSANTIQILTAPTLNNSNTQILSRNSSTGAIEFSTLSAVTTDTFVTGFTYSDNNLTITQNQGQSPLSVTINTMTGLTINGNLSSGYGTFTSLSATTYLGLPIDPDNYVTGGTYSSGTLTLDRQNGSVTITGFSTGGGGLSGDTYVTGFTYDNQNKLTLSQNQGQPDLIVYINQFSGLSINGLSLPSGYALSVTGDSIFNGDVYVNGDLNYNGNLIVTGSTIIENGLTANTIYTDYIDFNTNPTGVTTQFGRVNWDSGTGTLNIGIGDSTTGLIDFQVGQEEIVRVYNEELTTLQKGEIVYVFGSQGNRPSVKRAQAQGDLYSVTTLGMVDLPIAPGAQGYVTTFGIISNLNTLGLSGGTPIWLSPTTPGGYTSVKPKAPDHTVLIGYVVRVSATVGSIFVNISNGWELDELHDVRISGATEGDLLIRSSYSGSPVWINSKTLKGDYTINGELTITGSTNVSYIDFDTTLSGTTAAEGRLFWDVNNRTLSLGMIGGPVQQIGEEQYYLVEAASNILDGRVVGAVGTTGASGRILADYIIADGTIPAVSTMGILTQNLNAGEIGYVTNFGLVRGLDTTGIPYGETWSDGDFLYVSPYTGGTLTNIKPTSPNLEILVALVIYADASNGSIFVRPKIGESLQTLYDVTISGTTNGDLLVYNSTNNLWENGKYLTGNYTIDGSLSATTFYGSGIGLNNIPISGITNLQSSLDNKTNLTLFNLHTGDTNNPHQTTFFNLVSTAHTHTISDIINLQSSLDNLTASTLTNVSYIDFDITQTGTTSSPGRLFWDVSNRTLSLGMIGGVTQQIGEEQYFLVENQTTGTLNDGTVVRAVGTNGNDGKILVDYMIANGTIPAFTTIGVLTQSLLSGETGYVTSFGLVRGLDTSGSLYGETWFDGTILYVSPTNLGGFTSVKPITPNQDIIIAIVMKAGTGTTGSIFVRPDVYRPFKDPNLITVAKQNGDFTSIRDAVNSLSGLTSSSNRYVIEVGPGEYVEGEIDLTQTPYVSIVGSNIQTTLVTPSGSTQHIFKIGQNNEISFLSIGNAPSGYAAIYAYDIGDFGQGHKISIYDCDIGIWVESDTQDTIFYGEYIDMNGNFTYGTKVVANNGYGALANLENYYLFPTGTGTQIGNRIVGTGATINITSSSFQGNLFTGSTAIEMEDTAFLNMAATDVFDWGDGVKILNVGGPSSFEINGSTFTNNVLDINVEQSTATGVFLGISSHEKINTASSEIYWNFLDSDDGELDITRKGSVTFPDGSHTDFTTLIFEGSSMGLMSGGSITTISGTTVEAIAGFGYVEKSDNSGIIRRIDWANNQVVLSPNSDLYISIDENGNINSSTSRPNSFYNIILGRVVTNTTDVEFIDLSPFNAEHTSNRYDNLFTEAMGPIYAFGSIVTEGTTPFTLDVTAGDYYYSTNKFLPSGGNGITFVQYYRAGTGSTWVTSATTIVNNTQYDSNGVLSALTTGYYTKHTLYTIGDGSYEHYFLVLGQNQYGTLVEAEGAGLPTPPTYFSDGVTQIANIYIEQGSSGFTQVEDIRPTIGFRAGGVNASSVHGNLLGLSSDDHQQYLLVNGVRAMIGDLNMGTSYSITNVNLVDGVDVSDHKTRHQFGGSDPVGSSTPLANAIPYANSNGLLDSWISTATTTTLGKVTLSTTPLSASNPIAVGSNDLRLLKAVTGGTFSNITNTLTLTTNDGSLVDISGFTSTDYYVTGGTFNSGTNTLTLDRQNGSVIITGFSTGGGGLSGDTYVTGGTYSSGTLTLNRQNGSVSITGFTTGIKAGTVAGASFSGNPKKITVTFTSAYPNTNYSITITGNVNRSFTWESKATTGFTINSNANTSFTEDVNWITMSYGEF